MTHPCRSWALLTLMLLRGTAQRPNPSLHGHGGDEGKIEGYEFQMQWSASRARRDTPQRPAVRVLERVLTKGQGCGDERTRACTLLGFTTSRRHRDRERADRPAPDDYDRGPSSPRR